MTSHLAAHLPTTPARGRLSRARGAVSAGTGRIQGRDVGPKLSSGPPLLMGGHRPRVAVSTEIRATGTLGRATEVPSEPIFPIPQSLKEVDNGKILGFGEQLAQGHPGYHDEDYKQRRMAIAQAARVHAPGDPIPDVAYTEHEIKTWATAMRKLSELHDHACQEYKWSFPLFGFRQDRVPQLQDVSETLQAITGFQIRPVAGLLHPRDFLNGLAFKTFHSTQYMRHQSQPMYTPEPDVIHELLGHVPMLADPDFAAMAHAIGVASLGASEKDLWHLTKLYWHTVEFGVVREGDAVKAFGAGILSSFGELEYMAGHDPSGSRPELLPFDPRAPQPKMSYKDGFQRHYYVLESFAEGKALLEDFSREMRRPDAEVAHVLGL